MSRIKGDTTVITVSGQTIDRCSKFEYYMTYNEDPLIICHNEVLHINAEDGTLIGKIGEYRIKKKWDDILADTDKAVFKNKIIDAVDRWSVEIVVLG